MQEKSEPIVVLTLWNKGTKNYFNSSLMACLMDHKSRQLNTIQYGAATI